MFTKTSDAGKGWEDSVNSVSDRHTSLRPELDCSRNKTVRKAADIAV